MSDSEKARLEWLEKENHLLRTVIEKIHEGVYTIDENHRIIIYNHAVELTEGMKQQEVLGKTEDEVYPNKNFQVLVTESIIRSGKPLLEQYIKFALPNGRITDIVLNSYPHYYNGKLSGVITIGRDLNTFGDFIGKTLEIKKRLNFQNSKGDDTSYFLDDIIGNDPELLDSINYARKIAKRDAPVLIVGETGTGKELFAQGIHNASLYGKGPFVPVNCAAIPETLLESLLFGTVKGAFTGAAEVPGLFEEADDGTIFLDEINSMPLWLQAKLLRVLQDKKIRRVGSTVERAINCRIISATNIDPYLAIQGKTLRSDVFFRLSTLSLNIPPLRKRSDDIEVLANHFFNKSCIRYGGRVKKLSKELLNLLKHYDWPGNVRELQNVIESSINFVEDFQEEVMIKHLPSQYKERLMVEKFVKIENIGTGNKGTLHDILLDVEKRVIEDTLMKHKGNITKAAEELGIFRQALHYRIKKLGITFKDK
jgi:PAS domain S-box